MPFQMRKRPFTTVQTTTNRQTTISVPKGVVGSQRWAAGAIQRKCSARAVVDFQVVLGVADFLR